MPTALGNHEALVTELITNNYLVKKVYVDAGNSVDIMYYRNFLKIGLKDEQLMAVQTPLVGFGGHVVYIESTITLTTTISKTPKS